MGDGSNALLLDSRTARALGRAQGGHHRRRPAGVFDFSKGEARARGLRYIYNSVPKAHPDPRTLAEWLKKRGFKEEGTTALLFLTRRRSP